MSLGFVSVGGRGWGLLKLHVLFWEDCCLEFQMQKMG